MTSRSQPASALSMRCHHNKRKGAPFQQLIRLLQDFVRIASKQSLIKRFDRRQGRAIPQEHIKELEAPDVATQDNQAKRQRRRQDQADRSPDPAPENGGDNNRRRRQAGAAP